MSCQMIIRIYKFIYNFAVRFINVKIPEIIGHQNDNTYWSTSRDVTWLGVRFTSNREIRHLDIARWYGMIDKTEITINWDTMGRN